MTKLTFEQSFLKYEKMIHHLLHKYHIQFNYDEYQQLLIIKLWEILKQYNHQQQPEEQYCYFRLKFYLIDCLRKQLKYQNVFLISENKYLEEKSYFDCYQLELLNFLELLDSNERIWLNLTIQGYTTKEIALFLSKSISTVKYYRKNTRKKLSHYLLN